MPIALGLAAAVLFAYDPRKVDFYPSCEFYDMTGALCPGCGSLRCLHCLLHGDVVGAFRFNPLTVLVVPAAAYVGLSQLLREVRGRGLPMPFVRPVWTWMLLIGIVAFWVLRNTPVWPLPLPTS